MIGGDKAVVVNTELLFPIMESYGVRGVAFFDMGNAFSDSLNFNDFRRSVGLECAGCLHSARCASELGFPINKKPHDETSAARASPSAVS